jgi:hypothetical protein
MKQFVLSARAKFNAPALAVLQSTPPPEPRKFSG